MIKRQAYIERNTLETKIKLKLDLDGTGQATFNTGVPFFEHMLEQITRHGLIDMSIDAQGDLHIDDHHTVEDIGIAFGQAMLAATGDKKGIVRYGHAYVPLDEALSRVVIDLSGRPGLVFNAEFSRSEVGNFDTQLVEEFFQAFASNARITLHIENIYGKNAHHQVETIFKAFGRALRMALATDERMQNQLPSTKGAL